MGEVIQFPTADELEDVAECPCGGMAWALNGDLNKAQCLTCATVYLLEVEDEVGIDREVPDDLPPAS